VHLVIDNDSSCTGLDDLVEFAEAYFEERQRFRMRLAEDYEQLEKSPPLEIGECSFILWSYLIHDTSFQ